MYIVNNIIPIAHKYTINKNNLNNKFPASRQLYTRCNAIGILKCWLYLYSG